MSTVLDVISSRCSVRAYTDEPVSDEAVALLVEAALKAPTAINKQELHVSVVKKGNPVLSQLQNELNPDAKVFWHYNAPVVLFISGDDSFKWSTLDAGIAVENVHLAAASMGLGSVILGCIDGVMHGPNMAAYNKALSISEGYSFKIALAVGSIAAGKDPHKIDTEKNVTYVK